MATGIMNATRVGYITHCQLFKVSACFSSRDKLLSRVFAYGQRFVGFHGCSCLHAERRPYPSIYTRTGDGGTSATFTGERRPKDDAVFDALGTIDELSATIGLSRALGSDAGHDYVQRLSRVHCALQELGSLVATPRSSARPAHTRRVGQTVPDHWVTELEHWVDEYTEQLPPLTNFILPGGGVTSATLHLARTVCRRAERSVTPLVRDGQVDSSVGVYLNRLSDLLFTVARVAAKTDGVDEEVYVRPGRTPPADMED